MKKTPHNFHTVSKSDETHFVAQTAFVTEVNQIAHDVTNPLNVVKKIAQYFSNLPDIATIAYALGEIRIAKFN